MANKQQWLDAIMRAREIQIGLSKKQIQVINYNEGMDEPKVYRCESVQVNPCESFEDDGKFEFYVVLESIDKEESFIRAFPLERIKCWLE